MTTHTLVDHIARQVAEAEAADATALSVVDDRQREAQSLNDRLAAVQVKIASLRQCAGQRDLTEIEAASLNVALLDQQDLTAMISEAASSVQVALTQRGETQRLLQSHQSELARAIGHARRDALLVKVVELEAALVAGLTAAWLAAKEVDPMTSFLHMWQPGPALRRAVSPNHQPPNGDMS